MNRYIKSNVANHPSVYDRKEKKHAAFILKETRDSALMQIRSGDPGYAWSTADKLRKKQ